MNGREFLIVAEALVPGAMEAAWRSAASRAYYAAFHVARQFMEDLGFTVPPDEKAHAYLWLRLSNCGDPSTQQAGRDLQAVRRDRSFADYRLQRIFTQKLAQDAVQLAATVIRALDSFAAGPNRQQVADAIKVYERDVLQSVSWHP